MIFVKSFELINQSYPGSKSLSKDFKIEFSDLNLFVGKQGCGKSTLLNLLQKNHSDIKLIFDPIVEKKGVDTYYFNSELDNPRIKDPQLYTTISGKDKGIGYISAVTSRFKSHGEILEEFIIHPLLKAKDCVIFIDEPESGLSIENQFNIIKAIKKAIKNNCQLFIATHCYPLIKEFDVISLEHKKIMKGIEFLKFYEK